MNTKELELITEAWRLLSEICDKNAITLNCFICDKPMTSEHFQANDKIECPDCWVVE